MKVLRDDIAMLCCFQMKWPFTYAAEGGKKLFNTCSLLNMCNVNNTSKDVDSPRGVNILDGLFGQILHLCIYQARTQHVFDGCAGESVHRVSNCDLKAKLYSSCLPASSPAMGQICLNKLNNMYYLSLHLYTSS